MKKGGAAGSSKKSKKKQPKINFRKKSSKFAKLMSKHDINAQERAAEGQSAFGNTPYDELVSGIVQD